MWVTLVSVVNFADGTPIVLPHRLCDCSRQIQDEKLRVYGKRDGELVGEPLPATDSDTIKSNYSHTIRRLVWCAEWVFLALCHGKYVYVVVKEMEELTGRCLKSLSRDDTSLRIYMSIFDPCAGLAKDRGLKTPDRHSRRVVYEGGKVAADLSKRCYITEGRMI
jgi:hypothetical protein